MQIGDTVKYTYNEFDGHGVVIGLLTAMEEDHIIMTDKDAINYWFTLEDIDCPTDSMKVQIVPKEYVVAVEQRKRNAEKILFKGNLDPKKMKECKQDLLYCENELTNFNDYLRQNSKNNSLRKRR